LPEGLSPTEVGKEIAARKQESGLHAGRHNDDRTLSIVEAVLLSLVAVLAAYSGYAAAKWTTQSSLTLAQASALRTKASRNDVEGLVVRAADSASFNAWFTARSVGNHDAQRIAVRRMRPEYRVAFDAWMNTDPFHNARAPAGPAYMPQYHVQQQAEAKLDDARADAKFTRGAEAAATGDKYIRGTVILATVLFLVGISGNFRVRQARLGLITIGGVLLLLAIGELLSLPAPPA